MTIFLTGGTGLLGLNTIPALLADGHTLRLLVRDPDKAARVLPKAVETIVGDMAHPKEWLTQLDGCDVLIHAAAYFREYFTRGDHTRLLHQYNVELPVLLAQEAAKRGVRQIVMVSSSGVLEPRPDGKPTDETGAPGALAAANGYFTSKVEMEKALNAIAPSLGVPIAIVRPGWMFGPNDYAPTSAGQMVEELLLKRQTVLVDGSPICIADARDVGLGIAKTLSQGASGIYNLAGVPQTALSAVKTIATVIGNAKVNVVPFGMAVGMAKFLEAPTRLLGRPNPIPLEGVRTLHNGVTITSAKAEKELGIGWRPFLETAQDTVAFFKGKNNVV
jgi:dihydroflavonol-4-reductase